MYCRTFEHLTAQHDVYIHTTLMGMAKRLQLMDRRLADPTGDN